VNIVQLKLLTEKAETKPMVVQSRCFANRGWDSDIRDFCKTNQIVYEGFSLLTANPFVMHNHEVRSIARELGKTSEQVVFRFAMQAGIVPLTGTTSEQNMKEDLRAVNFELNDDVKLIEAITG
jgi:diketogulonate reductase-like aldo/keto reductase